jgi:methyltransferase (TIGR00027 family)
MIKGYSRTAEGVALVRALQQRLPASDRILDDPYAAAFLQNPILQLVASRRLSAWMASGILDVWHTGSQESAAIRARLADDLAREMAAGGLKQLVLLGAGFDSMALRIKPALGGVTVFEVDHPGTQAAKRKVMSRLGTPDNVRFVAVDFERDDFVQGLEGAGFDSSRLSLIVWMGVTYYLTAEAIARALTQIASISASGSRLTFDYMLREVVDGRSRNPGALRTARQVAFLGEPWIFGLEPEEVAGYLSGFGFNVLEDYSSEALRERYHTRSFRLLDYIRIVVCERTLIGRLDLA